MVCRMAKPEVNRIPLVGEIGKIESFGFHESAYFIHFCHRRRNDARKAVFIKVEPGSSRSFQVLLDLLQQILAICEERIVLFPAAYIPPAKIFPTRTIPTKNFPLAGQGKVRSDRKSGNFQGFLDEANGSAGIES